MTNTNNQSAGVIRAMNPATLELIREVPAMSAKDVLGVVEKAREAQKKWASIGISGRLRYFQKLNDQIIANIDSIAETITIDNGKTLVESVNSEIYPALDMLRFCEREARSALRSEKLSHPLFGVLGIRSSVLYEPLGVVAIIAPWNFPFAIPVTQILMALIVGNTVVFKPAALTAVVGELIRDLFENAGFPEGVLNVIQGSGGVIGEAIMDSGVNRVAFTGSVPVGKHLMKRAGETLTPITLELGGKDPFIVLEDADLERASSGAVWGAFVNAGQVCASVERVYVHRKIAGKFTDLVVAKTRQLRLGDGRNFSTDMGPVISESQILTVEEHINDAVGKGAKVLAGGKRWDGLPGYFFEPTVLVDVDHSMSCMVEETFGPTMPIMTYSDIDEAVEMANDSRFALTASVWSRNEKRAEDICRRIVTGCATVNDCEYTYGFAVCPWGGPKESGIGRTHSTHGLCEFANIKNICVTSPRFTNNLWWHPYSETAYKRMKSMAGAFYGKGVINKFSSATEAAKTVVCK